MLLITFCCCPVAAGQLIFHLVGWLVGMLTGVPFDVVLEGDENQKFSLKDDRLGRSSIS